MVRRTHALLLLFTALPLLGGDCAGDGGGGDPLIIRVEEIDPRCTPLVGQFPPGFDFMPGGRGQAVAVQTSPPSVVFLDIDSEPPRLLAETTIPPLPFDSDGDGLDDGDARLCEADTFSKKPVLGTAMAVSEDLVFVPASGYEEVIFFTPPNGELTRLRVTNPISTDDYFAEDYPYLPAEGESEFLSALSSKVCIYLGPDAPVDPVDSTGLPMGQHTCCDREPGVPSYVTRFTSVAGTALGAGRLFVATSNLYHPARARFFPGTVLIYDFDQSSDPPGLQPNTETPYVFTSAFNPTALTAHKTAHGRELILVTLTGAIGAGVGGSNIKTEGAIDVIDAASGRLVATVPLGLAGPSFYSLAIDPARRVALTGSTSLRRLYALDLASLDDERLYDRDEIVRLDGTDPDFPDARIYDADSPFVIPARPDGPPRSGLRRLDPRGGQRAGQSGVRHRQLRRNALDPRSRDPRAGLPGRPARRGGVL